MKKNILALILLGLSSACSTTPIQTKQETYTLSQFDQFKVSQTTKRQIIDTFGNNNKTSQENGIESISYFDSPNKMPRMNFYFDTNGILVEKDWHVRDGEKEQQMENILARYSGLKVTKEQESMKNPHSSSPFEIYSDAKKEISIVVRKYYQTVIELTWTSPSSRKLANDLKK